MTSNKACPVVLRIKDNRVFILAFRHPSAGNQLVKGGIKRGELPEAAALRELREESGIDQAVVAQHLGTWKTRHKGQIWAVFLCKTGELETTWIHHADDDGGTDFSFFWHPLDGHFDDDWHPVYREAVSWIRERLRREDDPHEGQIQ